MEDQATAHQHQDQTQPNSYNISEYDQDISQTHTAGPTGSLPYLFNASSQRND